MLMEIDNDDNSALSSLGEENDNEKKEENMEKKENIKRKKVLKCMKAQGTGLKKDNRASHHQHFFF